MLIPLTDDSVSCYLNALFPVKSNNQNNERYVSFLLHFLIGLIIVLLVNTDPVLRVAFATVADLLTVKAYIEIRKR